MNALLGSYGREGGFIIPDKPNVPKMSHPPYPKSDRPKVDSGRYLMTATPPMHELVRATLERKPYPIKAWIVAGTNFFHALPHNYWIKAAIGQLDALIVTDILPSEPTGYADVVFSECTYLERHDDLTIKGFKPSYISYRQPVIKPLYDTKPSWWIAKQLGQRMGLGDYFNWFTAEMMIDERLRKAGLAPHKLKQKGVAEFDPGPLFIEQGRTPKFATGTGKIELYSTFLEQAGGEPLPVYRPPEPIKDGYLRLLYGRSPVHSFSRTQNNTYSTDLEPENELWLHPAAAEMQGVGNGDRVFLENQDGVKSTFSIKVRLTQRIRPDCVYMVHGFGSEAKKLSKAYGKGASTNQLQTRVPVDVIMGSTGMSANDVRLLRDRDNAKKEDEAECIGLHETAPSPGGQTGKPLAR